MVALEEVELRVDRLRNLKVAQQVGHGGLHLNHGESLSDAESVAALQRVERRNKALSWFVKQILYYTSEGSERVGNYILLVLLEEPLGSKLLRIREELRIVVAGVNRQIHTNSLLDG